MLTIKEMKNQLKADGKFIVSCESNGIKDKHSYWFVFWNDSDDCEHIRTEGVDGGSSKAWQKKLATEKAIEKRYKAEYVK